MKNRIIRLGITPGAEDGVGPELLIKALRRYKHRPDISFFWCGDAISLRRAAEYARCSLRFHDDHAEIDNGPILFLSADINNSDVMFRQAEFLKIGVGLAVDKAIDAIVTGPVDKSCLKYLDDGHHKGQTEYFSRHLGENHPMMIFMGGPFLLSLLTGHLPLQDVASKLNAATIIDHIEAMAQHSSVILKKAPRDINMVILALNPHAGDDGLLGTEEKTIFAPAISEAKRRGFSIAGPVSADGFFSYFHDSSSPDVVIATYHDQGLIPYKLLAKGNSTNVTLGLSIPRTSPAHGTGYDMAKKNAACPQSTIMAIETAISLARRRV